MPFLRRKRDKGKNSRASSYSSSPQRLRRTFSGSASQLNAGRNNPPRPPVVISVERRPKPILRPSTYDNNIIVVEGSSRSSASYVVKEKRRGEGKGRRNLSESSSSDKSPRVSFSTSTPSISEVPVCTPPSEPSGWLDWGLGWLVPDDDAADKFANDANEKGSPGVDALSLQDRLCGVEIATSDSQSQTAVEEDSIQTTQIIKADKVRFRC